MASSKNKQYEDASRKYDEAQRKLDDATTKQNEINARYTGESGWKLASEQATQQANIQSGLSGTKASASANESARNSGLTKAQSALLGKEASTQAVGDTYTNIYNNEKANALGNNATTTSAYNASTANALSGQSNALGLQSNATTEGQNEYNRIWGNWGAAGSLLTSDARLKNFTEVSSKIKKPLRKEDWESLKIVIKKENE